jgi:hypothetical protein
MDDTPPKGVHCEIKTTKTKKLVNVLQSLMGAPIYQESTVALFG